MGTAYPRRHCHRQRVPPCGAAEQTRAPRDPQGPPYAACSVRRSHRFRPRGDRIVGPRRTGPGPARVGIGRPTLNHAPDLDPHIGPRVPSACSNTLKGCVNPQGDGNVPSVKRCLPRGRTKTRRTRTSTHVPHCRGGTMEGRHGNLIETGAYWLLYVVSVSGALLHWRLGNEFLSGICVVAAVLGAL